MAENEVCVIVLSYNRPRMLREALRSIKGADHLILIDDGSDFDAQALLEEVKPDAKRVTLKQNPKLTLEQRLTQPHVGRSINQAIIDTDCEIIAYLCDDDLFHEEWPANAKKYFRDNPEAHIGYGDWNVFNDGEAPGDRPLGLIMTTGSVTHRRSCTLKHGLWWGEHTVTVHDGYFVGVVIRNLHPNCPRIPVLAGWRREHKYNMLKYVAGHQDHYLASGVEVLRANKFEE